MICEIASKLNNGKYKSTVDLMGAKAVVLGSKFTFDINSFDSKLKVPPKAFMKRAENTSLIDNSLLFSSNTLSREQYEKLQKKPKYIKTFGLDKIPYEHYKMINEEFKGKTLLAENKRDASENLILHITDDKIEPLDTNKVKIKGLDNTSREFINLDNIYRKLQDAEVDTNKIMPLVASMMLYRGFDIVTTDGNLYSKLFTGIYKFRLFLKGSKSNEIDANFLFASDSIGLNSKLIPSFNPSNIVEFIDTIDKTPAAVRGQNAFNNANVNINTHVNILKELMTESELASYNKYKKASYRAKRFVLSKVGNVFKKYIPNLNIEHLNTYEIAEIYGPAFSNKKGFIIGNKIVINLDTFTQDTLFHEFGHFYMRWLENSNPELKKQILEKTKKDNAGVYDKIKNIYNSTGLTFSEEDILEELFVETLGIKTVLELNKVLPIDTILHNKVTVESDSDDVKPNVKKIPWNKLKDKPLESFDGINTIRIEGTNKHLGNPFSATGDNGTFKTSNLSYEELKDPKNRKERARAIRQAVNYYEAWLTGELDMSKFITDPFKLEQLKEQRDFILDYLQNLIDSDKPYTLLYYESNLEYISHADILDDIIVMGRKERKNREASIKEGTIDREFDSKSIDYVYQSNPNIAEVGSKKEYTEYLKTIFPKSEISDIVFYDPGTVESHYKILKNGFTFEKGNEIFRERPDFIATLDDNSIVEGDATSVAAILNISSVLNADAETSIDDAEANIKYFREGIKGTNPVAISFDDAINGEDINAYYVFNQNQVHIIGSNKDVRGFKAWKKKQDEAKKFAYKGITIDTPHVLGTEQVIALENLIDHVLDRGDKTSSFTVQGSAGTGKTTIIGLLDKWLNEYYGGRKNNTGSSRQPRLVFAAPTHAAAAQLALANLNNDILRYPFTLQSLLFLNERNADRRPSLSNNLDLSKSDHILVVDEASMLAEVEIVALKYLTGAYSEEEARQALPEFVSLFGMSVDELIDELNIAKEANGHSFKIIFLGDPAQIPSPRKQQKLELTSVFNTDSKFVLNKIYRQDPNTLLKVLNLIRKNKRLKMYEVINGDESLQFKNAVDYENSLYNDFENDLDGTAFIAYTNARVQEENKYIKKLLTGTTELIPGDKLVGYIGAQNKRTTTNSMANSISYIVQDVVKHTRLPVSAGGGMFTSYAGSNIVEIRAKSEILTYLREAGLRNLVNEVRTTYINMDRSDSLIIDDITDAELEANNRVLSDTLHDAFNSMLTNFRRRNYRDAYRTADRIKNVFISLDLGNDYIYDIENHKFVLLNSARGGQLEDSYGKRLKHHFIINKGVDFGYAITAHKSQGMTINNVYVDTKNIKEARKGDESPIYDGQGNQVNSDKNALYYVALSRASKKVVINKASMHVDEVLDNDNLGLNSDEDVRYSRNVVTSIEEFTDGFVRTLLGISTLTAKELGFDTNSSVVDIFNLAIKKEHTNQTLIDDVSTDTLKQLKEFFIEEVQPQDVYNNLITRGMIRKLDGNKIVLLDDIGNVVDKNGNLVAMDNIPKVILQYDQDDPDKLINEILPYLEKYKDLAIARFSKTLEPATVVDIINDMSEGVHLEEGDPNNPNSGKYYKKGDIQFERVSTVIQEKFSNKFNVDSYIKYKIYTDFVENLFKNTELDRNSDADKLTAHKKALAYIENKDADYLEEERALKEIFEFKAEEGTYLHNLAELFIRALNYSNKIDYGKKVPPNYFASAIIDNITNTDRTKFEEYFEKNFFSHLRNNGEEFKALKESFEFIKENMTEEDAHNGLIYLNKLYEQLDKNIFKKLSGPLTLMPEVRLASKNLGVAGTIDLLVIDGNGVAYIFDYKTKEEGKRRNWDYLSNVHLKAPLSAYNDNAMMKASIQTTIYRLMLREKGIQVGHAKIFYVESTLLKGADTNAFDDPKKMRYRVKNILMKPVIDVSAELLEYFKSEGKTLNFDMADSANTDIGDFITRASGGKDIDYGKDLRSQAEKIYDAAIRIAHKGENSAHNKVIQAIFKNLDDVKTGLVVRLKGGVKITLDPKLKTREEHVQAIMKLLKNKIHIKSYESILENIFLSSNRHEKTVERKASMDVDQTLRGMISGIDPTTHDIIKVSSDLNFGLDHSGVVMFKNRISGETRVVIINHERGEEFINFGKKNDNIFGNYITTKKASIKYKGLEFKNTTQNMRLVRTGLMLLKAKQIDPNFKIEFIVYNDGFSGDKRPILVDVNEILNMTKAMIEVAVENGEDVPKSISDLLENEKLFDHNEYLPNPIEGLANYLEMTTLNPLDENSLFVSKVARQRRDALLNIVKDFDPYQDYEPLLAALHEFRHTLENRLPTVEERFNNDLWRLTDETIMFLNAFNFNMSPKNTGFYENFLTTTSKASNVYQATFIRRIQDSTRAIRKDFIEYKTKMNELIDAMAKDKGIPLTGLSSSALKLSLKHVFANLYEDHKGDRSKMFILKSVNNSSLSEPERDFLKYYYKTLEKFTRMSTYGKQKHIPQGWMPLVRKSRLSARNDSKPLDTVRSMLDHIKLGTKFKDNKTSSIDQEFSLTNKLVDQIPNLDENKDSNFSYERRRLLGVDEYGNPNENFDENSLNKIEDNLENVLDMFVLTSLDTFHYRDVTAFGRALFYNIKRREEITGGNYAPIIETITLIQKRVISHQESDESNRFLNGFNKAVTQAAIAGTISQALLETFTNPLITVDSYISDKLYGALFKGQRKFSFKSYLKATEIIWSPSHKDKKLVEAINMTYGFTNIDTKELKETLNKLEKHGIFQSKHLMYVNKIMMENWQKITMTAYMIEQGTFYAHSIDADGNLVYDETKDKRFIPQPGDTKEVLREKELKKEAIKQQLAKERYGLTGTSAEPFEKRKMARALTNYDANALKELIVELYSSLDESSKSLATYYTWMKSVSKMRSWMFAKIPRYFQKPMTAEENASAAKLVKIKDPDAPDGYRFVWKGQATEGIYYSVISLIKSIGEYKLKAFKGENLTEVQKENFGKLLADLLVSSIVSAAAYGIFKYALDDDDKENEIVQLVYNRIMMATGDVFFLKSLVDLQSSSMFIGLSIAYRFAVSLYKSVYMGGQLLFDEDTSFDEFTGALNKLMESAYGPYRSISTIYRMATED